MCRTPFSAMLNLSTSNSYIHIEVVSSMAGRDYSNFFYTIVLLMAVLALAACAPAATPAPPASEARAGASAPTTAPQAPGLAQSGAAPTQKAGAELTEQGLKNAQYELPDAGKFQLVDGK